MGLYMIKMGREVIHITAPSPEAAYEHLMIPDDREQMPCIELYENPVTPEQKQYNKLMLMLHDPEEYALREKLVNDLVIDLERDYLTRQILEYQLAGRPVPQELRDKLAALPPPYSGPGWAPGQGFRYPHKPED